MCEFVKVWGGLPDGIFVKDLAILLKNLMPSDRVANGTFFKALAELKFPMSEMPAVFVNAVLVVHASSTSCVSDGVARYITKPDIARNQHAQKEQLTMYSDCATWSSRIRVLHGPTEHVDFGSPTPTIEVC